MPPVKGRSARGPRQHACAACRDNLHPCALACCRRCGRAPSAGWPACDSGSQHDCRQPPRPERRRPPAQLACPRTQRCRCLLRGRGARVWVWGKGGLKGCTSAEMCGGGWRRLAGRGFFPGGKALPKDTRWGAAAPPSIRCPAAAGGWPRAGAESFRARTGAQGPQRACAGEPPPLSRELRCSLQKAATRPQDC